MAIRVHDPDGTARRRAIRAAIAVPVGLAVTLYLFDDPVGAAFALFGMVGLLISSDFAGPPVRRTAAYLLTGVAGSAALLLGWVASLTLVTAVVVTMLITFGMTFLNMFRGAVSVGSASVLLVYVVAVSAQGEWSQMRDFQLGWWIAVLISAVAALVVLPRSRRASNRPAMAAAFSAAANAARAAWIGERDEASLQRFVREFDEAIDAIDARVTGQETRLSGVTRRDATLNVLTNHLDSIRLLVDEAALSESTALIASFSQRRILAAAIVEALDELSSAMIDPHYVISAETLDRAREAMAEGIQNWVVQASAENADPNAVSSQVALQHQLRIFALLVEQMIEMARVANGERIETLKVMPPVPRSSIRMRLQAQFSWESPWLRNAIRAAAGLGIGVLVMNLAGVSHGFWVLLGVISVLRFDAVGTRRYALLAIAGTAVGVVAGALILAVVGSSPVTLWIIFPLLVLLSAWAASAVNFPSGQAAFSAMVLVALGILNWPPRQSDALVRLEDIALGAAVAVVVGLLLWPRGAAGYLRGQLAESIRTSSAYLDAAIRSFSQSAARSELPQLHSASVQNVYRAGETFDIASTQPSSAGDLREWAPSLSLTYLLSSVAHIIVEFTRRYPVTDPVLIDAMDRARTAADQQWKALANLIDPASVDPAQLPAPTHLSYPTLDEVSNPDEARSLVISIWVVDWVQHLGKVLPLVLPRTDSKDSPRWSTPGSQMRPR